jgi:hypothetical protein
MRRSQAGSPSGPGRGRPSGVASPKPEGRASRPLRGTILPSTAPFSARPRAGPTAPAPAARTQRRRLEAPGSSSRTMPIRRGKPSPAHPLQRRRHHGLGARRGTRGPRPLAETLKPLGPQSADRYQLANILPSQPPLDQVRADEPRSTGDQDLHRYPTALSTRHKNATPLAQIHHFVSTKSGARLSCAKVSERALARFASALITLRRHRRRRCFPRSLGHAELLEQYEARGVFGASLGTGRDAKPSQARRWTRSRPWRCRRQRHRYRRCSAPPRDAQGTVGRSLTPRSASARWCRSAQSAG